MRKSVDDLRFHVLDPKKPGLGESPLVERAFELWEAEWTSTFLELGVERLLYSDDFLGRTLSLLSYEGQPVGLLSYDFFDLCCRSHRQHSYFKGYPLEVLQRLDVAGARKVMTISYLTVDSKWRRRVTDLPVSDVLIACSAKFCQETAADAMVGCFRNNRGVNEMIYRHGGVPILRNARAYNVDVDYAMIRRTDVRETDSLGVREATRKIWEQYKQQTMPASEKAA